MSQLIIYGQLKTLLESVSGIKQVKLFNSQFTNEKKENPFLYPCVFIQFTNSNFQQYTKGRQMYDSIVTLHIGFESYKDTDTDILTLKQTIYQAVHMWQSPTAICTRMLRVDERENFNHDNVQVYEQDYKTTIKDDSASNKPTTPATMDPALNYIP